MFQLPHKAIKDKEVQENFQAIEKATFLHYPEYPVGEAPNPPTVGAYIYTVDNGAGKTRLMALFPTGAALQIAIEP